MRSCAYLPEARYAGRSFKLGTLCWVGAVYRIWWKCIYAPGTRFARYAKLRLPTRNTISHNAKLRLHLPPKMHFRKMRIAFTPLDTSSHNVKLHLPTHDTTPRNAKSHLSPRNTMPRNVRLRLSPQMHFRQMRNALLDWKRICFNLGAAMRRPLFFKLVALCQAYGCIFRIWWKCINAPKMQFRIIRNCIYPA